MSPGRARDYRKDDQDEPEDLVQCRSFGILIDENGNDHLDDPGDANSEEHASERYLYIVGYMNPSMEREHKRELLNIISTYVSPVPSQVVLKIL